MKNKILVVDDNASSRKLVVTLLSYEGYSIVEAVDGADGLAAARRERPHLVISDILMPTMDGYEFVRQLRTDPVLADTTVIFYTANYHEREARTLAERCHVARVIVKPCTSADFLRAVEQALEQRSSPGTPSVDREFDAEHLRMLTDKLSQKAAQLKAANARLSALTELNVQLASEREPRVLLQKVCKGARNLLGARYAVLVVEDKSDCTALIHTTSGLDADALTATTPSKDTGPLGRVYREQRPWRAAHDDGAPVETGLPAGYPPAGAILAVPISSLTHTYGWLCLADKIGAEEFDPEDERMLAILGAQVGRIYENGSLYREVQEHATQLLVEMQERERVAAGLRSSEARFRQLAENLDDMLFISAADLASTHYVSPAYERIWGVRPEEPPEEPRLWINRVHPDDRTRALEECDRIAGAWPERGQMEYRIIRPDGEVRWILARIFPIRDAEKQVRGVGIATDITERKAAEAKIVHLNRVLAMLSGINSLIVRVSDRSELFSEACRLAVEQGRFKVAWCGWLDEASAELVPVAWAGEAAEHAQLVGSVLSDRPGADTLVASAIRARQPGICNDLTNEQANVLFRDEMAQRGYRSIVALPLLSADTAVGCLVLITEEIGFFDEAEMRLLNELSGDISFALDHIAKAERLNYLAYYDSLTGLANRTFFHERLSQHINNAQRGGEQFALVIADPERFESFNDTFGRTAGDELLRAMAARFARCAGDPDLAARIGSDQFAAVIPRLRSASEATRTIDEWWREWLGPPFTVAGQALTVSARAGIAIFPTDGTDAETLMRNADAALRNIKKTTETHGFYAAHLTERLLERRRLENSMRRALENEEFVLHYQPQVNLQTRRVTGMEALIRWHSPELGLLPPARFIPVMEETGIIVEVGAWALRRAILDRSRWLERGLPTPRVSVNVSTVQLRCKDFLRTVEEIVEPAGREAGLEIEVTESLLMEDVAENLVKLGQIRDLGIRIALDDFGTGYSSLAYLARLPVETLKIDRSFVMAMLDDPSAMTLVSTIISLAHALKLETVAEGVESEEQAKILRLLRCDQMQGYLISKPIPFDEMTACLGRAAG